MCTVYFKFISQIACIWTWFNTSEFSPGEFSGDSWGWRLEFPISILQLCEFLMSPWAKSKSWTSPNRKDSIDPCSMFNLSYPRHSTYEIYLSTFGLFLWWVNIPYIEHLGIGFVSLLSTIFFVSQTAKFIQNAGNSRKVTDTRSSTSTSTSSLSSSSTSKSSSSDPAVQRFDGRVERGWAIWEPGWWYIDFYFPTWGSG